MLTEMKLREKMEELKAQKLVNWIEWTEEDEEVGFAGDVTEGLRLAGHTFALKSVGKTKAQLYMRVDGVFVGILLVEKPTTLKERREAYGLSQSALAEKSGVNVRMIQHYEQGVKDLSKASFKTIKALADALGCHPENIVTV